ncbi:MAG: sigma-54-dependent transcriptional regulator [Thiothrix sp.]
MTAQYIMVVDDEPDIRQLVAEILEDEGYKVVTAENAAKARELHRSRKPDLILLDIWMPGQDGISLLKEWREHDALCCPVIMMSGHGTIETAVEATKLGAYDFIEKPLSMAKMLLTIGNALRAGQLEKENRGWRKQMITSLEPVGSSQTMQRLREQARRMAQHANRIALYGEPGVGKESFARYIHSLSSRKDRPFVKAALSSQRDPQALTSLLFGSESGDKIHYGLLDEANGGVLFLAEIYELDPANQTHLLNALKEKRFKRLGGSEWVELDIILMVSSSHDLQDDVNGGKFSEELYYLLNVVPLMIPPLNEHPEDVPELLNHYVDVLTAQEGLPYRHISLAAQNFLRNQPWRGNIRELRNLVQRLLILGTDAEVSLEEVEEMVGSPIPVFTQAIGQIPASLFELPLRQAREQFEHDYLVYQLRRVDGNVSKLADQVQMERTHLYRKMRALNVDPKKYTR